MNEEPHLIDDRPTWDLIQKRNEEFLKELEAKYGPQPVAPDADDTTQPHGKNGRTPTAKQKAKSA